MQGDFESTRNDHAILNFFCEWSGGAFDPADRYNNGMDEFSPPTAGRTSLPRWACLTALIGGAAFGALLFAAVGSITHLQAAGAFVGCAVGALIGLGLWSGHVSVMTIGGIFGAAFFP